MTMVDAETSGCPVDHGADRRKSARLAERHVQADPGSEVIRSFGFAREILRSRDVVQNGAGAEQVDVGNPEHVSVFYLDGDIHKRRRAAIKGFFTPNAVTSRHQPVMERTTDALLAQLRVSGRARLDDLAFELAVTVASGIVGLTESEPHALARRIANLLRVTFNGRREGGLGNRIGQVWHGYRFLSADVRPAVRARRARRRDDIISQTLDKGYSERAIMIECMTYATAGMVTTREFIVMVAWYLFERPELRVRFLASDARDQIAILQEILRLEPVAARVFRRVAHDTETGARGSVAAGSRFEIDLRSVNSDESVVGECPFAVDPERGKRMGDNGTFLSFGDGAHRCPGWQLALHETRVFVDRLLRVPGIRLEREPDMLWNPLVMGYELRDAIVTCDQA